MAGGSTRPPPDSAVRGLVLGGIAASSGVAVGRALVLGNVRANVRRRSIEVSRVEEEIVRLYQAVDRARTSIVEVSASVRTPGVVEPSAILDAYLAMLSDPMLLTRVEERIRKELKCAEWAVLTAADEIAQMFTNSEHVDGYLLERRHDIEFVSERIARELMGAEVLSPFSFTEPTVIIAHDLSPADTAAMAKDPVLAFVTEVGTKTSHTAIMARALEIPAVVGATDALALIRSGDVIVVDGLRGEVIVNPNEVAIEEARTRAERHYAFARDLLAARNEPQVTLDGTPIVLKANIELPVEAVLALDHGAQGVGPYPTEFVYINRKTIPTEDEQYELYRTVVETMAPRPVTLRTFDIGGDKFVSSFQLPPEMNPALGLRAIRLALRRPEIFMAQLRAVLRASAHGDVRIMIPMVATLSELRQVRDLIAQASEAVDIAGHKRAHLVPIGMMVEVPSAVMQAEAFTQVADFFSVGTNDLVQYTLAVDRTNQSLAPLATPLHPAILQMLRMVERAATKARLPLSLCGAMASDPMSALLLVGLGYREFSMEASAIPTIKETLRRFTVEHCQSVALEACAQTDTEDVENLLSREFSPGLYDILTGNTVEGARTLSLPPGVFRSLK